MSLLWTLLDGGRNAPTKPGNWKERMLWWAGYKLATRHPKSHIHPSCLIHPDAHICPRGSEIHIGEKSIVAMGTCIQGNVRIGNDCSVQMNGNLVGYGDGEDGRITIGNYVRIAANSIMIAANHAFSDPDTPIHKQGMNPAPIIIADDVWLGGYVKIVAGVTIGEGSVIGMGSVVTKDIPPYSIAVGAPAKVIKSRK